MSERRAPKEGGLEGGARKEGPEGDAPDAGRGEGARRRAKRRKRRRERAPARRHPDIEIARLLVKRRIVTKDEAVECLRVQKQRAKAGKQRVPFLQLLVKERVLDARQLPEVQDEIRRNTYLCDNCDARAVILAGSQSRAGACPRCGHAIAVEPTTGARPVPARELIRPAASEAASETPSAATQTWRPLGDRALARIEPGQLAFGRYEVQGELGRGAMGIVYRARHLELGKDVALKVLVPNDEARDHQVARFRREAAAVQKLKHAGIVAVHDFGSDGDLYYLTMDLVEGGESLHQLLKRRDAPAPLDERLNLLLEVADAVAHAHERGIIHRDLKPANVLIGPDGRARVADFGLAKDQSEEEGELTRTHDRLGTPLFMAPEQIRKGAASVDGRADVWALGVMLFVCLTGRYPFRSRTVMDLYLRILREEPDWTGDRFSAPDRKGFRQEAEPPSSEPFPSTHQGSDGMGSAGGSDSEEASAGSPPSDPGEPALEAAESATELAEDATEVTPRDRFGRLPKTLGPAGGGRRSQAASGPPAPPFAPPPELEAQPTPAALKAIVSCALAKDPEDRYPDALAFARDLSRYLAGEKVAGGGPSLVKRVRGRMGRRRGLRALATGLACLLLVGGAAGLVVWRDAAARELRLEADREAEAAWAQAAMAGGERGYAAAEVALDAVIARVPTARAHLRRGQSRLRRLRFDAARADLERARALALEQGEPQLALEAALAGARLELSADAPAAAYALATSVPGSGLSTTDEGADAAPSAARLDAAALAAHAALAATDEQLCAAAEARCRALAERSQAERSQAVPARELDPQQARALAGLHAALARLAQERGDLKAARASIAAADALASPAAASDLELMLARARLLSAEGASPREVERAYRDARRAFPEAADPLAQYLNQTGYGLYQAREYEALLAHNAAAGRLTTSHKPYYYLGNTLLNRLGRGEEALEAFREAARRDPFDRLSRDFYLALLLPAGAAAGEVARSRLEEAAVWLEREAQQSDAADPSSWLALAAVRLRLGQVAAAWATLDLGGAAPGEPQAARAALLRAAVLRRARTLALPLPDSTQGLDPDVVERTYGARTPVDRVQDWLEVGRVYLDAGDLARAEVFVEAARREPLSDELRRLAELYVVSAAAIEARILFARGDLERGFALLSELARASTLAPELTPSVLPALPEIAPHASDPRLQAVLEAVRSRGAR